jgi:hypothetical protein
MPSPTNTGYTNSVVAAGITSKTLAHTATAGSNQSALVALVTRDSISGSPSSCTYNGVTMSYLGKITNLDGCKIFLYHLHGVPSGTSNVVLTFGITTGSTSSWMEVTTFKDTTNATPTLFSASGTNMSVNVTSTVDSIVQDWAYSVRDAQAPNLPTLTEGAGQTRIIDLTYNDGTNTALSRGSTEAGAASVTMSWTCSSSSVMAAVSLAYQAPASNFFMFFGN